uniref:Uncharacterized protein n=1 Tax=Anopheles coluzzii TaxID=1518534 RepID=A0A8W7PAN0_ANOCL
MAAFVAKQMVGNKLNAVKAGQYLTWLNGIGLQTNSSAPSQHTPPARESVDSFSELEVAASCPLKWKTPATPWKNLPIRANWPTGELSGALQPHVRMRMPNQR